MNPTERPLTAMDFPERLATLRKDKGLTQKEFAEAVGVSAIQLHRYEAGASQPPLDVIRQLAVVLGVSADLLLFDKQERGPDEELRLQFEAVSRFSPKKSASPRSCSNPSSCAMRRGDGPPADETHRPAVLEPLAYPLTHHRPARHQPAGRRRRNQKSGRP